MTTLSALPILDVYIAFNPTASSATITTAYAQALPASGASNSYWTNVGSRITDLTTNEGKQHMLDTVEAGTLRLTALNVDGFFFNGAVNGTNLVLEQRQPIAVTATYGGTTYPIFWGLIDDIEEVTDSQIMLYVNISACDQLKQLSNRFLSSPGFWATYANPASGNTINWYNFGLPNNAVVTFATGNGTTITYHAINNFTAGQYVTVTGLNIKTGKSLNMGAVVVASATSRSFTVTNATVGTSNSGATATAYVASLIDKIGTFNALLGGYCSFPTYGSLLYDSACCVDLANGSGKGTGWVQFGSSYTPTMGGVEFWVLGQNIAGTTFLTLPTSGGSTLQIGVDTTGSFYVKDSLASQTTTATTPKVNDGFWHHVGMIANSAGNIQLYVDGDFTALGTNRTGMTPTGGVRWYIGANGTPVAHSPCYIDQLILSGTGGYATLQGEVANRYRAGSLLTLTIDPVTSNLITSGDRIAEVLAIAGYGSISGGQVVTNSNLFYISSAYQTPVIYAAGAGRPTNGQYAVEAYYWDTPVFQSTAMDLIAQITETDIGVFFQKEDGTFQYFNQGYFGSWTPPSTWTPSYTTPAGIYILSDASTDTYHYEATSLKVTRDDADLWTCVKVTPQAGVVQIYENTSGEARWGYSTLSVNNTVHASLAAALSTAQYLGYIFRSPLPRIANVELQADTGNGGNLASMLGVYMGDVVQFKRVTTPFSTSGTYPSVMGQINQPMAVESKGHDFRATPGSWATTFVLNPFSVRT